MKKTLIAALLAAPILLAGPALAEAPPGGPARGEEKFAEMDLNGDGVISHAEFVAQREQKFARTDVNQDGLISFDEAMAAKKAVMGGQTPEAKGPRDGKGKMFTYLDIDRDGFISLEEMEVFSDRRFKDMDSNLDGQVTLLEAKAAMRDLLIKRSRGRD